jgi:phosphate transport system substrate-binding protein
MVLSRNCHSACIDEKQITGLSWPLVERTTTTILPGALAALLGIALLAGCGQRGAEQLLLNGTGATFPNPLYAKWTSEYHKVDPNVSINYQPTGSGGGQKSILDGKVDFGATDGPMSDENLTKAPGKILHIPTVAGADVVSYNLPGNPTLRLDGPAIAAIFLGKVSKWNDAMIAKQNSGLALPAMDIVVIHRSDGSGTTFIFTDYLSSVSSEWENCAGRDTSVKWPAGQGAKGNEGVTEQIKQIPGAIGYIELVYAVQQKLPFASVKNAAGNYIAPSIESVTAALATAKIPDDFRFSMINPAGEWAYPISGATWLLVYQKQANAAKGKKLVEFLRWVETQGQAMAPALDYAPLPEDLSKRVLKAIDSITY